MKITNDTSTNYENLMEVVHEFNLTGTEVADLFINWNGLQVLDSEFMENFANEYNIEVDEEEEDC